MPGIKGIGTSLFFQKNLSFRQLLNSCVLNTGHTQLGCLVAPIIHLPLLESPCLQKSDKSVRYSNTKTVFNFDKVGNCNNKKVIRAMNVALNQVSLRSTSKMCFYYKRSSLLHQ